MHTVHMIARTPENHLVGGGGRCRRHLRKKRNELPINTLYEVLYRTVYQWYCLPSAIIR